MTTCKMISLDTSTSNTGFAIWENAILKRYGCIDKEKVTKEDSLKEMVLDILEILNEENPDIIITEITAVPNNANTQRVLTMLLGAIYSWSIVRDKEYDSFRPSHWRKLVYEGIVPKKSDELKIKAINEVWKKYNIKTTNDNIAEAILIGEARIREFNKNYIPITDLLERSA